MAYELHGPIIVAYRTGSIVVFIIPGESVEAGPNLCIEVFSARAVL